MSKDGSSVWPGFVAVKSLSLTALIVACNAASPKHEALSPRVDTTMVFIPDSRGSGTFPDLPRRAAGNSYVGDPDAPACALSSPPDTGSWRQDTAPSYSRYVRRITFLLPAVYEPFPHQPHSETGDTFPETGAHWQRGLGSWWFTPQGTADRHEIASFGLWIGPQGRYPTVGVSPPPRQLDLHECRMDISGVSAHVVVFTLEDTEGVRTRYVGAYWPLEDGVWLSALGDSPESLGPTDFLFTLRSMGVLRP
jgi:hypothetical protein